MVSKPVNIRTWSESVPSYGLRLRDLDLFLMRDEPGILRALGWRTVRADEANVIPAKRWIAGITFFMPFAGMAAYTGGYDAQRRVQVDGLGELAWIFALCCFVLALWGPPMVAYRWRRADRHWDVLELAYLVTTVLFGLITLGAMAGQDGIDVGALPWISLPVWLTLLPAAAVLVAMLFSRGRRKPTPAYFRREGTADPALTEERIDRLDPARARRLLEQRAEAVATLRRRGLIDNAQATALTSRPLGRFHDDVYR
ncbi:hypothetical protein LZ318_29760 [Saccharopolyspora indica]|uniref:hypothetical protein n=1 Tax=Saccharopolyspora indica TaxID=1229659 RepID=UPI002FE609D8